MTSHIVPEKAHRAKNPTRYIIGLDLGVNTAGMAALAVDGNNPTEILSALTHVHDGGVGPGQKKESTRAISGVARRARRRLRHRKEQRAAVDAWLTERGFDTADLSIDPWEARARLTSGVIANDDTFYSLFSAAVSHIARHRGWRNPYQDTRRLHTVGSWSDNFTDMTERARELHPDAPIGSDPTPGELAHAIRTDSLTTRLRGTSEDVDKNTPGAAKRTGSQSFDLPGILSSHRIHQSDHARELARIFEIQRIDDPEVQLNDLIDVVFHQESPRGSAAGKVGACALDPATKRVSKAQPVFQRYRIATQLANARVRDGHKCVPLSTEQRQEAFTALDTWTKTTRPTWSDVESAAGLGIGTLVAPAAPTDDGEDITGSPCYNRTHASLWNLPKAAEGLRSWYRSADGEQRAALVTALSNVDDDAPAEASDMLASLSGSELEALDDPDNFRLEDGRGAYSAQTCATLSTRILSTTDDLHSARKHCFGVDDDWTPPAADLIAPTGNSAVDRSLHQVSRWLNACERRWGTPVSVVVENGRDGLTTVATAEARAAEARKRAQARSDNRQQVATELGMHSSADVSLAAMYRHEALVRQKGMCAFSGVTLSHKTGELVHIVPRSGPGSTNTRDNLVLVSREVAQDKGNQRAVDWIESTTVPGVSLEEILDRIKNWSAAPGESPRQLKDLKAAVKRRLFQKVDDASIDTRSMESTSWMATEIRRRLVHRYKQAGENVSVRTYSGATTAAARSTWVAGDTRETAVSANTRIRMHGGMGKQTLDHRNSAVDAALIAVMGDSPARVLAERRALRTDARMGFDFVTAGDPDRGVYGKWSEYTGRGSTTRSAFEQWKNHTRSVIDLIAPALDRGDVQVTRNVRFRLGDGKTHDDTVRPLTQMTLGKPWPIDAVNRVADHRVFTALVRLEDFDPERGLPPNNARTITVQGTTYGAKDKLNVMGSKGIPLRGGYVTAGKGVHHHRLYSTPGANSGLYRESVATTDLLSKHIRNKDLLTVDLPEHSYTRRFGGSVGPETAAGRARRDGTARFLGAVVPGDELVITEEDAETLGARKSDLASLQGLVGPILRWKVVGGVGEKLELTPWELSREGVTDRHCEVEPGSEAADFLMKVREGVNEKNGKSYVKATPGRYRLSLGVLANLQCVRVIRRDVFGRERPEGTGVPGSFVLVDNQT